MPQTLSAVNILLDACLPEDLRDPQRIYDKKGVDKLMTEVAKRYPDKYAEISKQIGDIGRNQAYRRGETFRLDDFRPTFDRQKIFDQLDQEEAGLRATVKDPAELKGALGDLYARYSDHLSRETNNSALAKRNNIAITVLTGARGKEAQLRDMISSPGFYSDASGGVVPWFVKRSFAEGLSPADLMAGTYAARASVTESKSATAKGGFMAKTLSRAAAEHVITQNDCGTTNGIDLPIDEPDLRGRVLQKDAGGYKAGTVLDRKVLEDLRRKHTGTVVVRSPLTCGAEHGLCAKCFGVKAEGRFPKIGDHVGITAATALGEPVCLAAGTEVRMADGSQRRIEDVKPGELVLGSDMYGNLQPTRVVNLFHNGPRQCVLTRVRKGHGEDAEVVELLSTDAHKILSHKGEADGVAAILTVKHDNPRHVVYLENGKEAYVFEQLPVGILDTWDIEVDNDTHLFMLSNGLIVSNTQQSLSLKHVTSGKGKSKEFSGLDYLQQFMDSPEEFKDRSVVATRSGHVEKITPAAQGGNYVTVGGHEHYVPLDREITVTPGEQVEAGDSLTDGLLDVEDVLKHKGLGEARRYWADRMAEMAKASSAAMDRRQFEVLARANVDHVDLEDPIEDGYLPDDRVRYSEYIHRRTIPEKVLPLAPHEAVGKWLEQPVLHHTVGTMITPKIAEHIEKNGYGKVYVSDKAPSFQPVFVRLQQVAATNDDWLASLGGAYLGSQLQQGITRAQDTNVEENTHPVPRLAVGVGYGDRIESTGKF